MESLRRPPLGFDVMITQKDLFASDPNLVYYPLVYIHGRAAFRFDDGDLQALRQHLEPGGGTLFADAACGSAAFDAAFRRFVAELLPNSPLVPIPRDDALLSSKVGFDLKDVQYTDAAGGAPRFSPARRSQAQRPLGDHLLKVRHRLCPRTSYRDRLQGLHARERCQNRRQHCDLLDAALKLPRPRGPLCSCKISSLIM